MVAITLLLAGGCARPITSARAVDVARRNVCGAPGGTGDAACTVRSTEKIRGGYRVVLDRKPPAGNDHLVVEVRGGGSHIEVMQVDSASVTTKP